MGNTHINYLYRDSGNNKYRSDFVVEGELWLEQLRPYLYRDHVTFADEVLFVPQAVGLPHLLTDKWDSELDHNIHELEEFELVDEQECVCSSEELLKRFKIAYQNGWLEYRPQ